MSFTKLARRTAIPRAQVSMQIRTAIQAGDLKIVASVNPVLLGYSTVLHLGIRVNGGIAQIIDTLSETPSVMFVARCAGAYDIVAEVRGKSRASLRQLVGTIRSVYSVTAVESLSYEQIIKSPLRHEPYRERFSDIDVEDRILIFLLQQDGRMSFDRLAQQTGLSAGRARARVRRLIDSQILTVRAARGRLPGTVEIVVGVGIWARTDAVAAEIAATPMVEFLASTLGKYDYLASISGPDPVSVANSLDRLRSCDGVIAVESWANLDIVRDRHDAIGTRQ